MPLYDYICASCGAHFEEIASPDADTPACPQCGGADTQRQMSAPSPLKTGAFPYKVGPVHPLGKKMAAGAGSCAAGGCGAGGGFS